MLWSYADEIVEMNDGLNPFHLMDQKEIDKGVGLLLTDRDSNIIQINRAFTEITGYEWEEVCGKNPRFLQSGLQDESFYNKMWKNLLNKGRWNCRIWNTRKDGTIFSEWLTIQAVHDANEEILYYVATFVKAH